MIEAMIDDLAKRPTAPVHNSQKNNHRSSLKHLVKIDPEHTGGKDTTHLRHRPTPKNSFAIESFVAPPPAAQGRARANREPVGLIRAKKASNS